jgi:hypothetical protein
MQLYVLFIDSNTLHVLGRLPPIVSSLGTECAAYGTGMLIYVVISSTVFYAVMSNVIQYNADNY